MPDYQKGKIYKIVSEQTELFYVGSTAQLYLCNRMSVHKCHYKSFVDGIGKKQSSAGEILKYDDAKIVLLESFSCNSKDELHAREQFWMDLTPDLIVNKLKAYVGDDKEQYYSEMNRNNYYLNREARLKTVHKYREENKEKIQAYQREINQCDCGMEYTSSHYNRHCKSKRHQEYEQNK